MYSATKRRSAEEVTVYRRTKLLYIVIVNFYQVPPLPKTLCKSSGGYVASIIYEVINAPGGECHGEQFATKVRVYGEFTGLQQYEA